MPDTTITITAHNLGDDASFDTVLPRWRTSVEEQKVMTRYLAEEAALNFYKHGSTNLCQACLEAFETTGKNYIRRAAYLKWLVVHLPIKLENGRLRKDDKRDFNESLLAKAMGLPFWDFEPEKIVQNFGAGDVVKLLNGVIKNLEGKNAKDEDAVKQLNAAREAIGKMPYFKTITPNFPAEKREAA